MTNRASSRIKPSDLLVAYHACAKDLAGLQDSELVLYTLDAMHASTVTITMSLRLQDIYPELQNLSYFDIKNVDKLRIYGDALLYAHEQLILFVKAPKLLKQYAKEGKELRSLFFAYATSLVLAKKLDPKLVARLKAGRGYRDLIEDLGALVQVFVARPELTQGGVVDADRIRRASELVQLLLGELSVRKDPDQTLRHLLLERRRVATVLVRAHHQVSRAVKYLRDAEGDADHFAPTLYAPTPHKKRKKAGGEEAEPKP